MSPEQLYVDAMEAIEQSYDLGVEPRLTLVFSKNSKRPKGFPRGEFLSETEGGKVYRFDPNKIITWLIDNRLIKAIS